MVIILQDRNSIYTRQSITKILDQVTNLLHLIINNVLFLYSFINQII